MYQEIFKQGKIGNITLKNRLVMSPMGTSLAEMDGSPSEDMIAFYEARAIGGAALIIPEIARVNDLHGAGTVSYTHLDVYKRQPLISVVAIVMIIGGIVAINAEKILSCGVLVLGVVAIHNFCGMMLGLLAAKIFHVEYTRATAIAIEVGMQNSGLAVSLAAANFVANPLATLPGAIFSVWHNIAGSIFAGIRRSGVENRTRTGENGVSAA